jgi:hypothetical protein
LFWGVLLGITLKCCNSIIGFVPKFCLQEILQIGALNCFEKLPYWTSTYMFACKRKQHANCKELLTRIWTSFVFTHHSLILLRELLVLRRQGFCHITYLCCLFSVRQMSSKQNPEVGSSSSSSSSSSPFNQRVGPPPHHQAGFVFSAAFAGLTFILYLTLTYIHKVHFTLMFVPLLFCAFGQNAWLLVLYCKAEQSRQYCHVQMWGGLKGLKLDCRSLSKADNSWIRPVIKDC